MDTVLMVCIVAALLLICTCNLMILAKLVGIAGKAPESPKETREEPPTNLEAEAQKAAQIANQLFNDGLANLLSYDGTKKEDVK